MLRSTLLQPATPSLGRVEVSRDPVPSAVELQTEAPQVRRRYVTSVNSNTGLRRNSRCFEGLCF